MNKNDLIKQEYDELIPATYDKMFKIIFTDKDTKDFTAKMISEITHIPFEIIKTKAIIRNNDLPVTNYKRKKFKTDILIKVGNHFINIEMNRKKYKGLSERNLLYQSTIASGMLDEGEKYLDTPIIYQINFNKFKKFNTNKVISECLIMEKETHEIETDKFIRYHINIERAKEKWYNNEEISYLEKMIALLDIESKKDAKKIVKGDNIMEQAFDKLDKMSNDEEFKINWDYERDARMIENSIIYTAKEEGIQQGIKEEKYNIVKNMLDKQIDLKTISEITGLTLSEIEELSN